MKKINRADTQIYRIGTSNYAVLKFFSGDEACFKMMVDCSISPDRIPAGEKAEKDLKTVIGDCLDLLIITNRFQEHLYNLEALEKRFIENLRINELWLGGKDKRTGFEDKQVETKKQALAKVGSKLSLLVNDSTQNTAFVKDLNDFLVRHSVPYVEPQVVTEKLRIDKIRYVKIGDVISDFPNARGLRFLVLPRPEQKGRRSYPTDPLTASDAFAEAILADTDHLTEILPFDRKFNVSDQAACPTVNEYEMPENRWRSIEYDWLDSAATLALQLGDLVNNPNFALSIEQEENGETLFFST